MDGRGTPNRGRDWERIIKGDLASIPVNDQAAILQALGAEHPELDLTRVGIYGWSFGGFMTTSLMLRNAGTFNVGVAGGPVTDWKYYEIMYGERYMDRPEENVEGYENNRLHGYVENLEGDLMLIHGTIDDVVVVFQTRK